MSPTVANFLFEVVNFLLFAAAVGWVFFRPVRAALDAERDRHAAAEEDIRRRQAAATALSEETRAAHEAADRDIAEQRTTMLGAARTEAARVVEAARQAQAEERRAVAAELEADRRRQASELADVVGRIAADSVRRLLATLEGPALDLALVRAACREVAAHLPATAGAVTVESARPLDAESRQALAAALGAAFTERVVPELGAGVRLTSAAGQVDASAQALARQAARAVVALGAPDAAAAVDEAG